MRLLIIDRLRRFAADERGSAYTLSYVMVLPFMILLIAFIVETALILVAQIGVTYAAFAANRAAIVWGPNAEKQQANRKVHQAAVQAMVPFANGLTTAAPSGSGSSANENSLMKIFHMSTGADVSDAYVRRKYRYADREIKVSIEKLPPRDGKPSWEYDLRTTVDYRYTFHVPLLARMFASPDGKLHIRAESVLPCEAPMNEKESLGISYASP